MRASRSEEFHRGSEKATLVAKPGFPALDEGDGVDVLEGERDGRRSSGNETMTEESDAAEIRGFLSKDRTRLKRQAAYDWMAAEYLNIDLLSEKENVEEDEDDDGEEEDEDECEEEDDDERIVYAVRIGWLPGIYDSQADAEIQTLHCPGGEMKSLEVYPQLPGHLTEAKTYLSIITKSVIIDAATES